MVSRSGFTTALALSNRTNSEILKGVSDKISATVVLIPTEGTK